MGRLAHPARAFGLATAVSVHSCASEDSLQAQCLSRAVGAGSRAFEARLRGDAEDCCEADRYRSNTSLPELGLTADTDHATDWLRQQANIFSGGFGHSPAFTGRPGMTYSGR